MKMPRRLFLGASVLGLAALLFGLGASQHHSDVSSPSQASRTTAVEPQATGVASTSPEWRPPPRMAPRFGVHPGYTPKGFDPDFREHIVADLGADIDAKLGKNFSAEKRKEVARIQNEFWDEHGPNVDAFHDGLIDQPEFAKRTHEAMANWSQKFGDLLSDEEHERLFDVPRYTDVYPLLFHSPSEQPGMPFQPEATNGAVASADQPAIPDQPSSSTTTTTVPPPRHASVSPDMSTLAP